MLNTKPSLNKGQYVSRGLLSVAIASLSQSRRNPEKQGLLQEYRVSMSWLPILALCVPAIAIPAPSSAQDNATSVAPDGAIYLNDCPGDGTVNFSQHVGTRGLESHLAWFLDRIGVSEENAFEDPHFWNGVRLGSCDLDRRLPPEPIVISVTALTCLGDRTECRIIALGDVGEEHGATVLDAWGDEVRALNTSHDGWRDLLISSRGKKDQLYRWAGRNYVVVE